MPTPRPSSSGRQPRRLNRRFFNKALVGLPALATLSAIESQAAEASVTALKVVPTLGGDNDLTDGWEGLELYDLAEFKIVPTWSDGKPDPDCTRAGSPPKWTCTYGWFEGQKQGMDRVTMAVPGTALAEAKRRPTEIEGVKTLWSTDFKPKRGRAATGKVTVRYGGQSATVNVTAQDPDTVKLPIGRAGLALTNVPLLEADQGKQVFDYLTGHTEFAKPFRTETHFKSKRERVRRISNTLEKHIRGWLAGKASADIPSSALLDEPGLVRLNNVCGGWTLCRPEEVAAEEQWGVRPAKEIPADFSELYYLAPDPHCTYLFLPGLIAPLGTKLVVEGQFPHSRFMNYQIAQPYDPRFPAFCGSGSMEVPIVDVDIAPNPGCVNPFRVGADRTAAKRDYRIEFLLTEGDAVSLNERQHRGSMTNVPVAYRGAGNTRIGGAFVETGVWGGGAIIPALLWLRYYAPDKEAGPLGGVSLPKCSLELPSGERFWIKHDVRLFQRRTNLPVAAVQRPPADYKPFDSKFGWAKAFGGWLLFAEAYGIGMAHNPVTSVLLGGEAGIKRKMRDMDRDLHGRGPDMPAPGCYETGSTWCAYINYPQRLMSLPEGKILVITGKLPKTPKTRQGETHMSRGQARYWSLTRYGASPSAATSLGVCYDSIMDDEIVTATGGRTPGWYILVLSAREDRPANATAAHRVTWRDWGPDRGAQSFSIRWLSVMPDWHDAKHSPDENNLPWSPTAWSSQNYNASLIGRNQPGVLGDYHPVLHLMTKAEFEALGAQPDPRHIPHAADW